jgi:hypothetical protein
MTVLTEENLKRTLESLIVRGSWATAALAISVNESTLYRWLQQSRRAQEDNDSESPFLIEWQDQLDYYHAHAMRARTQNIFAIESLVRDQLRNGLEVPLFDGQGRPQWRLNLDAIAQVAALGDCDPFSKEARETAELIGIKDFPYLLDEAGRRQQATRVEQVPASLKVKLLSGLLPRLYGDRVDVNVTGQVVQIVEPAPYARPKTIEHVDERPDIAELREQARRLALEGPKHRQPTKAVTVYGRERDMADDVPLEKPKLESLRDHARAYEVERPPQPKPNYHKRGAPDPVHSITRRPGASITR